MISASFITTVCHTERLKVTKYNDFSHVNVTCYYFVCCANESIYYNIPVSKLMFKPYSFNFH